jgi:hypothetical protein
MRRGDRGWTTPVLYEALHTGGRKGGGFDDVRTAIGVRTARYSMLVYRNGAELYDLVEDPLENRSRWDDRDYRFVRRALRQVWWDLKDCRGADCRIALPARLAAGPHKIRRMTTRYWRVVDRVYGWLPGPRTARRPGPANRTGASAPAPSAQVEAVELHDLDPAGDEVVHELLPRVVAGIDLRDRAEL